MQLQIFTNPQQGATYDDILATARAAEVARRSDAGGMDVTGMLQHGLAGSPC